MWVSSISKASASSSVAKYPPSRPHWPMRPATRVSIVLTEASRSGAPRDPRKYFWATMLVAFWDRDLGNSTSRCSKAGSAGSPMTASRCSHSTSSKGWTPGVVWRRSTVSTAVVVFALFAAISAIKSSPRTGFWGGLSMVARSPDGTCPAGGRLQSRKIRVWAGEGAGELEVGAPVYSAEVIQAMRRNQYRADLAAARRDHGLGGANDLVDVPTGDRALVSCLGQRGVQLPRIEALGAAVALADPERLGLAALVGGEAVIAGGAGAAPARGGAVLRSTALDHLRSRLAMRAEHLKKYT